MDRGCIVALGRQLGPRRFELLCNLSGCVLTPDTRVTDEALLSGRAGRFLADLRTVERDGVTHHEAIEIRPLAPNPTELARLVDVQRRFLAAGVADPVGDPHAYLTARFADPVITSAAGWDPERHVVRSFLSAQTTFPLTWWHDDPEPGITEMVELVRSLGLPALESSQLLADAGRDLDQSGDEDGARDRLCAVLVARANELLEGAGDPRRLQRLDDQGEPLWVLLSPAAYAALARERLLVDWAGRTPRAPTSRAGRPPDRGEIDLDDFPSGDDPF